MIVVELHLKSAVSTTRDRLLGKVLIANDGTGLKNRGYYEVRAFRPTSLRLHKGRVENFPRKSRSALELLRRALNALHDNGGLP